MDIEPELLRYKAFLQEKAGPVIYDMAEKCGHNFDKIEFSLCDISAPIVGINPKTAEMLMSRGALQSLQTDLRELTPEFRAVLAHEIAGHVGHDKHLITRGKLSIIAAPAVAVGAYELLRRYNQGSPEERAMEIAQSDKSESHWQENVLAAAKYVAIGAIGLAAGGFIARHMSRAAEFAADRRAVEFTKDPEALIAALRKIEAQTKRALREQGNAHEGVWDWLKGVVNKFENATVHAHPELDERIAAIRSLGKA